LLEQIGISFEIIVSDADETIEGEPYEQVALLARRKAEAASKRVQGEALIIAADTLVYAENRGRTANGTVLGKPADAREAYEMLQTLQGRKHTVYTGVAIIKTEDYSQHYALPETNVFVDAAYVYFRPLTDREIHAYIATGEPFDKAGAYGIQEKGALLIERIEGDFYTVMGLPISKLCIQLEDMGVEVWKT
jgi:septum formation protein